MRQWKREFSSPPSGERSSTVEEKYPVIAGDETQKPWRSCTLPYSWTIPAGMCLWSGSPETWHPKTLTGPSRCHFIPAQAKAAGLHVITPCQSPPVPPYSLFCLLSYFCSTLLLQCSRWLRSCWCLTHHQGSLEAVQLPCFLPQKGSNFQQGSNDLGNKPLNI